MEVFLLMKIKKYGNTEKIVYDLAVPIAEELGLTIWDVCFEKEGAEWYLRVYIDKEDGVTIDDCENLSRPLNDKVDEVDPIKQRYFFEVGSAGLGRSLIKEHHFAQSIGVDVDVTFIRPHELGKVVTGVLTSYDKESITLNVDGTEVSVQLAEVSSVKIHEDFDF
jgi:ribosome maturation factor RimP